MILVESLLVVRDGKSEFYLDGKRVSKRTFEELRMFAVDLFNFRTEIKNGATYYRETLKTHEE